MKKKISIIVPVFNEGESLLTFYTALTNSLSSRYEYEIIFIDDGSSDTSWDMIKTFIAINQCVKGIKFSRNFGHQIALIAGYDNATGDALITLDSDMQHPPQIIPELINKWEEGFPIVYTRPYARKHSLFKNITAHLFYTLFNTMCHFNPPKNVGDFRLIDKEVRNSLGTSYTRVPYLRGLIAWTGFNHTIISYHQAERHAGHSKYTLKKMFNLAFQGITGLSLIPLKVSMLFGIVIIMSGCGMFFYISLDALYNATYYPLFKWLMVLIFIFMGISCCLLWLLGEYIGRIVQQRQCLPMYIISKKTEKKA
jgi:polyisoprenyl-phosphate glycosyltransferase